MHLQVATFEHFSDTQNCLQITSAIIATPFEEKGEKSQRNHKI